MDSKTIRAKVKAKEHANLDSFPFRFGYSFPTESTLMIKNCVVRKDTNKKQPPGRCTYDGDFSLPGNSRVFHATFMLLEIDYTIVTVIRKGPQFDTEDKLSDFLRDLRKQGKIDTDTLIEFYNRGVSSYMDLFNTLCEIDRQKADEASEAKHEDVLKKAYDHVSYNALRANSAEEERDKAQSSQAEAEELAAGALSSKVEAEAQTAQAQAQAAEAQAQAAEAEVGREKADKTAAEEKAKRIKYEKLAKSGNLHDTSKQGKPVSSGRTFKVLDAGIETMRYNGKKAVYVDITDGVMTNRILNSWINGQSARLALAQALIGEEITYDTWGGYSERWFYHLHKT